MPGSVGLGRFSRCRLRGTQGARVYTTAQVWVPAGICGARSGQSRAIWQLITGFLSASPSLAGQCNPHDLRVFPLLLLYHVRITPSLKLSSCLLCGSHGTTAVVHQALPLVTATDGASVCVRVCAMFPVDL